MKWFAFFYTKVETTIFNKDLLGKLSRNLGSHQYVEIDGRLTNVNAVAFALGHARKDPSTKTHILLIRAPTFKIALDQAPDYSLPNKKGFFQI